DEPLVELETDKVTIEVPAPAAGVLADIAAKDGDTVAVGAVLGQIKEGAAGAAVKGAPAATPTAPPQSAPKPAPKPAPKAAPTPAPTSAPTPAPAAAKPSDAPLAPSVRKLAAESGIDAASVPGSGKDGRVSKGDMLAAIERAAATPTPVAATAAAVQMRA